VHYIIFGLYITKYGLVIILRIRRVRGITNRRPLYRNRELVYWLKAIPRPELSSGFISEALSSITGSILRNIACY
jgi:hypothetical protein